jgi:putative flippase GtrA
MITLFRGSEAVSRKMITPALALLRRHRETIAYLFTGGTTVLVNIAAYRLCLLGLSDIPANTAAFFLAVMYAYFANCLSVFRQPLSWRNFRQFWGMRIGTLLIDDGGMWLLLRAGCPGMTAKVLVNTVVIILNYIFSKLFIFKGKG